MSFGSAGYTETFTDGDLSLPLSGRIRRALRKKRKEREKRELKKPYNKTSAGKKELAEEIEDEKKEDEKIVQEVAKEEKQEKAEQKRSVTAAQKLLPAARAASASTNSDVVPVVVRDVSGKPTTALLPSAKNSSVKKGGGIAALPPATRLLPPAADTGVQQTTAIVKRNNDAILKSIKGEVNDVRSAVIDVSFETIETRNMMGALVKQENDQTNTFKKQAQILDDSIRFKKRKLLQQLIFLKQQQGKKKKDLTGSGAIGGAAAVAGTGNGRGLGLNPLALLPFLRNWRPRNPRNRNPRNRRPNRDPRGRNPRPGSPLSRRSRFRNRPGLQQRYNRFRAFQRNRRLAPLLRLLRGAGGVSRGLANLTMLGGAYGLDLVMNMAERRSMLPGRNVQPRQSLFSQVRASQESAAEARRAAATQPNRSLPSKPSGSSALSEVRDPVAEMRKKLAQEVRDKGLKSKSTFVTNARGQRELVEVTQDQVKEILKKPKAPFFQRLLALADSKISNIPGIGGLFKKLKTAIVKLKSGLGKLSLPKAVKFLQSGLTKIGNMIPKKFGFVDLGFLKKGFNMITAPVRAGLKLLGTIGGGAKALMKPFGPLLKAGGRLLGPLLEVGFFINDAKNRMDAGKSPAAAMIPLIPRIALSAGGAAALGAIGGPFAPLTAMAGGFLGGLLGDKVVDWIDGAWQPDWDSKYFKGFNNDVYALLSDKLGYNPPKSEEEANNRAIEKEAAELGVSPMEYADYTGGSSPATGNRETPGLPETQGSAGQRLLRMTGAPNPIDAASKFIFSKFRPSHRPGHNGLDISGGPWQSGADLSVVNPGKVIDVGDLSKGTGDPTGWGNFVVVSHADGTQSLYGHLDSIDVRKGDDVARGTVIGKLGNTGASQGPHLHFELGSGWNGGVLTNHVDPSNHIDRYVAVGGAQLDGTEFRPREGTEAQTTAAILNNSISSGGNGSQTIAVQLPPNIYPMGDANGQGDPVSGLQRVNNELLYMQNVEAKVLVG